MLQWVSQKSLICSLLFIFVVYGDRFLSLKKSFMGLGIPTVYANVYKHGSTKKQFRFLMQKQ